MNATFKKVIAWSFASVVSAASVAYPHYVPPALATAIIGLVFGACHIPVPTDPVPPSKPQGDS